MVLYETDVEMAKVRDKKSDVQNALKKLESEYHWLHLGEEGKRIGKILRRTDPNDEMGCLYRWAEYLEENLNFPVQAIVDESVKDNPVARKYPEESVCTIP